MDWKGTILMALSALLSAPVIAGEAIFVVSDVYGIRPDGACMEIAGGDLGALKQKNVHWDGASKTIKMYAAKNEEAAVQIVIPTAGKGYWGKMSDLAGPGTIPGSRATFSTIAWVKKACPDLVVPLDGSVSGIKRFDVPISLKGVPSPGNKVGLMLLEVWIPKDAKAGDYKGIVSIMKGDAEAGKLNVALCVYDFVLPDMPTFAFDLLSYGMPGSKNYIVGSGLTGKANNVPAADKKRLHQIYKLSMDNRCFVNVLPYSSQRGYPRYAYPVKGQGAKAKLTSYAEYDDFFAPILDGKCNKFGQPPAHFTLCFNINYPVACESEPRKQFNFMPFKNTIPEGPGKDAKLKDFETTWKTIAAQYVDHFAKKGWKKTRFEIYHNQKANKDRNRSPWKLDEPCTGPDYKALGYLFNLAHWAFEPGKAKGLQFVTRIDIGHFNCDKFIKPNGKPTRCYKAKGYNKANADKYLKETTDHWVIGVTHTEGAQHLLKDYERPGGKLIMYGTSGDGSTELHYGHFAGEGFKCARLGIVGRVIYKLGVADPANPTSHYIMYNGAGMGFEGGLASHRLKLWRNAVNDFDYIAAARKKDQAAAEAIVNRMTKTGKNANKKYRERSDSIGFWFTNNVEDITAAKAKLAEIITGRKVPEGMKIEGFSSRFSPCGTADKIVGYD